jgi:hypothetical protein
MKLYYRDLKKDGVELSRALFNFTLLLTSCNEAHTHYGRKKSMKNLAIPVEEHGLKDHHRPFRGPLLTSHKTATQSEIQSGPLPSS